MEIEEFNIYRYTQVDLSGRKGILVYAYSKRAYGNSITSFLKNLKSGRITLLNSMTASKMPTVRLNDK